MKFAPFCTFALTVLITSCQQTSTEQAQAAVAEYVQYGMSKTGNYRSEGFYVQPFTRQDSVAYVLNVTQRTAASQPITAVNGPSPAPTADFTRRAQERQHILSQQADTTRIGTFVRHIYRNEDSNGTVNRDSVDVVVYPPRDVVVLFKGQVPLQPESRVPTK